MFMKTIVHKIYLHWIVIYLNTCSGIISQVGECVDVPLIFIKNMYIVVYKFKKKCSTCITQFIFTRIIFFLLFSENILICLK